MLWKNGSSDQPVKLYARIIVSRLWSRYKSYNNYSKRNERQDKRRSWPEEITKKWHLYPEEQMIIFVGRLEEIKGTHFLIRAFQLILQRKPQLPFMDSWWWRLSKFFLRSQSYLLQNNFHWFRWSNLAFELYRLADVGVVPSYSSLLVMYLSKWWCMNYPSSQPPHPGWTRS